MEGLVDENGKINQEVADKFLKDIWKEHQFLRGKALEEYLARTSRNGYINVGYTRNEFFPNIDFAKNTDGVLEGISVKSLDPKAKAYTALDGSINKTAIKNQVTKYAEKLASEETIKSGLETGETLTRGQRVLEVVVPKGYENVLSKSDIVDILKTLGENKIGNITITGL